MNWDYQVIRLNVDPPVAQAPASATEASEQPGEATVTVPPGMAVGRSLRLKGKGWPSKGGRGDLLLSLSLKQPASYSDQERQLLEQLRAARSVDPRADWISAARL